MALADMIQLLFTRLPTFSEDYLPLLKKLKMSRSMGSSDKPKKSKSSMSTTGQKRQKGKREKSPNEKARQENMASTIGNSGQKIKSEVSNANTNTSVASDSASMECKDNPESKSDTTSLSTLASPSTDLPPGTPVFNVDSDVLARSPIGSVSDLTALEESTEPPLDTNSAMNIKTSLETENQNLCEGSVDAEKNISKLCFELYKE